MGIRAPVPDAEAWRGERMSLDTHRCKGAKYPACSDDTCYISSAEHKGKKFRGRCSMGWFVTFLPVDDNGDLIT